MKMKFGALRLELLLVWTVLTISVNAESEGSPIEDGQFTLTRRILEPPPTREGYHARVPRDGALVLEEHDGNRQASLIQEDNGIQYKVLNDQGDGTYEFGYDTRSSRKGARFFRHEEKGIDGRVKGQYGFVDANGDLHVIVYVTDALGHRIRTETHKIEGYGHELTRILESGLSSKEVKDQINAILENQVAPSPLVPRTTDKPETTTDGLHRTTRSTRLPTGLEPYFDDAEPASPPVTTTPRSDFTSAPISDITRLMAFMDRPVNRATPKTLKQTAAPKTFSSVNMFPSLFNNAEGESTKPVSRPTRRPAELPVVSTTTKPTQNGHSRFFILHTTPIPNIASFPTPAPLLSTESLSGPNIGKDFVTSLVSPTPSPLLNSRLPWTLNIPIPQTETLPPDDYDHIREYLRQILKGSGKSIDDINMEALQEQLNRRLVLGSLESLLSGGGISNGKNLAVIAIPTRIEDNINKDDDIIHGDVIDGGIINADEFFGQLSADGTFISGGTIDGGIIGDDFGKSFNGDGSIIDGGQIDGGILEPNVFDGEIINGGLIGEEHKNGDISIEDMIDKARVMNLMALEKLLQSENAENFIGLLNIEKIIMSENIDKVTKAMILNRMLQSDDEATVAKVLRLREMFDIDLDDIRGSLQPHQPNEPTTLRKRENLQQMLDAENDPAKHFMILQEMLKLDDPDKQRHPSLKVMMEPHKGQNQGVPNIPKHILDEESPTATSVIDQLINLHKPTFPAVIDEPSPQSASVSPQPQVEVQPMATLNQILPSMMKSNFNEKSMPQANNVNDMENMDKLTGPKLEMEIKDMNNEENNSHGHGMPKEMNTLGKDVSSGPNSPRREDNDVEQIPSFVGERDSHEQSVNQRAPGLTNEPNIARTPDAIHYMPSPDLSTGRPDSQHPRPPVLAEVQLPRPGVVVGKNSHDDDDDDDENDDDRRNLNLISPVDHKVNSQSSWAIRPLSISSLSPHRSPVFINSTVYVTTTAAPGLLGIEGADLFKVSHPRIIRPDLAGQRKIPEQARPLLNQSRRSKGKSLPSRQMNADLMSEAESNEDKSHTSIKIKQEGNDVAVTSNSASTKAKSQEKATGAVSLSLNNQLKVTPLPAPVPTTLATPKPTVNHPSTLHPHFPGHHQPHDLPLPPPNIQVSTLPAPPPIVENRPPIHFTTVVPPTFHPNHRSHVTTLPHRSRGLAHSPVPLHKLPHTHSQHGSRMLTRHGREFRSSKPIPIAAPPVNDHSHDSQTQSSEFSRGVSGRQSKSLGGNIPRIPFIPGKTDSHTISTGTHHVFVRKNLPSSQVTLGPPLHSSARRRTRARAAISVEDIEPVLHDGPPLIPTSSPTNRLGQNVLNPGIPTRRRNSRLRRRNGRRVPNRRL